MATAEHAPETSAAPAATLDVEMLRLLDGGDILAAEAKATDEEAPGDQTEASTDEPATTDEAAAADTADAATTTEEEQPTDEVKAAEIPAEVQAQLDAATKERDDLKAEATRLREEVQALKNATPAPVLAPTADSPLAHVTDERALAAHRDFNEQVADWALENLTTGGTMPVELDALLTGRTREAAQTEPMEFDAKQTAKLLKTAQHRLNRDIPDRINYLRTERAAAAYVEQHYPNLLKTDTEEGRLAAQFEREFPQIKVLPTWRVVLTDLVRGAQLRIAEENARTTGGKPAVIKPAVKPAPKAPVPPGAPRGAGAAPAVGKPASRPKLSASMSADELAAAL